MCKGSKTAEIAREKEVDHRKLRTNIIAEKTIKSQ